MRLAAHADGDGSGQVFGRRRGGCFYDYAVAVLVGHGQRRRIDAVDGKGLHFQLGERPAHAVAVDHWQPALRCERDRDHRIQPPRLKGDNGVDLPIGMGLVGTQREGRFVASGELFNHDGRRPHHAGRNDVHAARKSVEVEQLDGPVLADGLLSHQLADVGIAATSGSKQRGADRQVVQVFGANQCHGGTYSND